MNPLKKIAGINLAVLFAYSVLIRILSGGGSQAAMGILIMSAFAVGIHVLVCLIVTAAEYSKKTKDLGRAWLLSSGIVLLVGFSTCLGNTAL
jgi:hypothetical protein